MKKKMNKKIEEFTLKEVFDIALKYGKSCTSCPFYQVQYFPCNHFCDMNDRDKKLILSSIEEEVIIDEQKNTRGEKIMTTDEELRLIDTKYKIEKILKKLKKKKWTLNYEDDIMIQFTQPLLSKGNSRVFEYFKEDKTCSFCARSI